MSNAADDPRCPECGGPIGQTATYCMHCSADLTEERAAADTDEDGVWDQTGATSTGPQERPTGAETTPSRAGNTDAGADSASTDAREDASATASTAGEVTEFGLAPDGLVDNTLTALVGIAGGLVVGAVGTTVLLIVTGSGWAVGFGFLAWLGATAYLVRRRTVQDAVAKGGYAVALVLLLVPVIALSPVVTVEGGIGDRGGLFVVLVVFVAVPAGIAAAIGWAASQFVPEDESGSEG